jgi:hypothetical protein
MSGPFARRPEHPYLVDSLADLPSDLRKLAEQVLEPAEPVNTIFVVPPQTMPKNMDGRGGMHRLPEQALLFTAHRVVHVQVADVSGMPGQATWLSIDQLFYVQLIMILLYGRLEFYGVEGNALTSIVVEYNIVAHNLLQPALHGFLRQAWGTASNNEDRTETLLEGLGQQSFKFRNGLRRYGLLPGAKLLGFAFQPRIAKRILRMFDRIVTPAALLAFTENELVVIEEGRTTPTSYGWFITFCPRDCLAKVETVPNAKGKDVLIRMRKGSNAANHQVTLDNDTAQAWLSLWSNLAQ